MLKLEVPESQKRVLLHSCCAPCSGAIIESLVQNGVEPVIFFSNSNIFTREEYDLRKAEILRYAQKYGLQTVDDTYNHSLWLSSVKGLEKEPERGERCLQCFLYRLVRAAEYAQSHGIRVFTTSLASSRWKDLQQVDRAGQFACSKVQDVIWWNQNWRKGGLQLRRSEIIREQNFYNQTFCGCEFSRLKNLSTK